MAKKMVPSMKLFRGRIIRLISAVPRLQLDGVFPEPERDAHRTSVRSIVLQSFCYVLIAHLCRALQY